MLQDPSPQQYEIEMVTMEQLDPKDHLVRKIDKAIDFEFIRDQVALLYCQDNGRPPVNPFDFSKSFLLTTSSESKASDSSLKRLKSM